MDRGDQSSLSTLSRIHEIGSATSLGNLAVALATRAPGR